MTLRNSGPLSNLAARLGHSANSRLLIVNCDDLGSSHSANVATFRSIVYGVATSATIMVPCPWAREAAYMFKDSPDAEEARAECRTQIQVAESPQASGSRSFFRQARLAEALQ